MRNFSLGNLDSWQEVPINIAGPIPGSGGPRSVRFNLMASAPVEVYADTTLVAVGEGLLRVRFTVEADDVELLVSGADGTAVFVQQRYDPQIILASDEPSFATIEPRGVGPSTDVQRMMMFMRINAERREAILREEIARLGRKPEPQRPPERPVEAVSADDAHADPA